MTVCYVARADYIVEAGHIDGNTERIEDASQATGCQWFKKHCDPRIDPEGGGNTGGSLRRYIWLAASGVWRNTHSERVVHGFISYCVPIYVAFHPELMIDHSGAVPVDTLYIKKHWYDLPPGYLDRIAVEFSGTSKSAGLYVGHSGSFQRVIVRCHNGALPHTGIIHTVMVRTLRALLGRLMGIQDVFVLNSTTVEGMPDVYSVLVKLHQVAEQAYEPLAFRFISDCREAEELLRAGSARFRDRLRILLAELYMTLLHSNVAPNKPPSGLLKAFFHEGFGDKRFDVLVELLRSLIHGGTPETRPKRKLFAAEIGVDVGFTSSFLLDSVPQLSLLGVDPYIDTDENRPGSRSAQYADVLRMLSRYGSRSKLWRQKSVDAASHVNWTLDFVFIDGDHSAQGVFDDLQAWVPKVRSGGIVAGHDFDVFYSKSVVSVVQEHAAAAGVTLHLGPDHTFWYFVP